MNVQPDGSINNTAPRNVAPRSPVPASNPAQLTVVTITRSARDAINAHLAESDTYDKPGRETGGVLLGHDTGSRLAITHAGGPGPAALRTKQAFQRDLDATRRFADVAYAENGAQWIGEWHSHPSGPAAPSARDIATYFDFLIEDDLAFRVFAALIAVSGCATPNAAIRHGSAAAPIVQLTSGWQLSTWLCDRNIVRPKRLHLL